MKRQLEKSHAGMIIALGALLAALWGVIAFGAYEEAKRDKYEVRVKPGTVTYGTHSTATVPTVTVSTHRSSVPMISGGSVRAYAHYGHASMPKASSSSSYRLHTTSSATVHTIGSGGGGSAGGGGVGSSSSSRGISYSSGSVSMPTLAMATPSRMTSGMSGGVTSGITTSASSLTQGTTTMETSSAAAAPARPGNIRKAKPSESGSDGEWQNGGDGPSDWWYYDDWAGDWVAAGVGDLRPAEDGKNYYRYDGGGVWTLVNDQGDPVNPTPLGDAPWHWMLLLALSYGIVQTIKIRKQKLN